MNTTTTMITTQDALSLAIEQMRAEDVIAVDTEFIREKTYYPQLCLIQIAYGDQVALVDPLAGLDLSPLRAIMCNPNILKVFHSGQQDLEILYHLFGEPVQSIFDTQVAAALVGMTDQVSYGTFIKTILDHELEKGSSFSVWSRRPLMSSQLQYAQDDVVFLLEAYPILREKLEELGRLSWLDEEFAYRQTREYVEDIDSYEAYRQLKRISTLNPRQTAIAREVAAWRQSQAIRQDRPRRRILPDESVIEIARKQPLTPADLENVRGLSPFAIKRAQEIISAVHVGKRIPDEKLPQSATPDKPAIEIESTAQLARALVSRRSKEYQIAPTVLASQSMIEEFVRTPDESAQLLSGWRKMLIGEELLDLIQGKIALSIEKGKLQVTRIEGERQMR